MRGLSLAAALALAAAPASAQQAFPGAMPAAPPAAELASTTAFRVCADPANAPLSVADGSGFENKIAELFAARLERPVEYTWFPQTTGFIRRTLAVGLCDVVIGYPQGDELVQNTNHYYSSAFVLVVPAGGPLEGVASLRDPKLQGLRVGVVEATPPVDHLLRAGLLARAKAYPLFVDRRVQNPAGDMLGDLEAGEIDAAVLWGPIAGPLVKADPALSMQPLLSEPGMPKLTYRITMGVRVADQEWKRQLNSLIRRNQAEIDAILREAGVPLVDDEGTALKAAAQ